MTFLGVVALAAILTASDVAQTRPVLEARFIGNMSYVITDGTTTLFTDFPYQSGCSGYMAYDAREIRSATMMMTHNARTLTWADQGLTPV